MKSLFIALSGLLIFTACSKPQVVPQAPQKIELVLPALAKSIRYWCIGSDITRKCTTFTTHYKWYAHRTIKCILKGGSFAILEAPEKELAKIACNTNEFEVIQYDPL